MRKRVLATMLVFSMVLTIVASVIVPDKKSAADAMSDWPLAISADPNDPYPPIGPNVGEKTEIVISGLKKGNKITSFKVKNYSPKIVKIAKKKKTSSGASIWVKGLKKGEAHIKVTVKLKRAQDGKKTYVWNIKKYPVGYN